VTRAITAGGRMARVDGLRQRVLQPSRPWPALLMHAWRDAFGALGASVGQSARAARFSHAVSLRAPLERCTRSTSCDVIERRRGDEEILSATTTAAALVANLVGVDLVL